MLAGLAAADDGADPPDPAAQRTEYLWPCNLAAWQHWQGVQTQWRTAGMGGATGLDYAAVRAYLDEHTLAGQERQDIFTGICAAERATLQAWAEKARAAKQQQQ